MLLPRRVFVLGLALSLAAAVVPVVGVSAGEVITRPDLLVRRPGGPLKGDNIYNSTGAGQIIYGALYPAGTIRWAYIYAQNDGNQVDSMFVDRVLTPQVTGISVKYFTTTGLDITAQVVSGGFSKGNVAPGERFAIRARIEITSAAAHGATLQERFSVSQGGFDDYAGFTIGRR